MPFLPFRTLSLLAALGLAACGSDPEPEAIRIDGIDPPRSGTLAPEATLRPDAEAGPAGELAPETTLAPDVTLQPDSTEIP